MRLWKVGELAERTGLTVRTLHHWDEIGLLQPSSRSAAGYRLYDSDNLARLQQILSLRHLGFSLAEIRDCLERPDGEGSRPSLVQILRAHAAVLRDRIDHQRRLCERLEAVAYRLEAAESVSAEELIETLEAVTMFEKQIETHYTPEQLEQLAVRRRELGEGRIREVEAEWPKLIAAVRAEQEKGTDPESEVVQKLALRWQELVQEFTGGDAGIAASLRKMYQEEPAVRGHTGIDAEISAYIGRALEARESS